MILLEMVWNVQAWFLWRRGCYQLISCLEGNFVRVNVYISSVSDGSHPLLTHTIIVCVNNGIIVMRKEYTMGWSDVRS